MNWQPSRRQRRPNSVAATEALQTALLDAANVQANACVEPGTSMDAVCPLLLRQQDPGTTGVIQAPYNVSFRTDHRFMVDVIFWYRPEGNLVGDRHDRLHD